MKHTLIALVVATGLACTASVTSAADWNGVYAGGVYSSDTGHQIYESSNEYDLAGDAYGVFAGYNVQTGSLVYGGEIAYSTGGAGVIEYPEYHFTQFIDLKGRVGFTFGDALAYGVLGWSIGTWNDDDLTISTDGFNAGVGVDYMLTDSVFLGAEYLFRNQHGTFVPYFDDVHDITLQSLQVRIGMKF